MTVDPRIAAGTDCGASDGEWRRTDWNERSIELSGGRIDYAEVGEGEPLLFVHGLSVSYHRRIPRSAGDPRRLEA